MGSREASSGLGQVGQEPRHLDCRNPSTRQKPTLGSAVRFERSGKQWIITVPRPRGPLAGVWIAGTAVLCALAVATTVIHFIGPANAGGPVATLVLCCASPAVIAFGLFAAAHLADPVFRHYILTGDRESLCIESYGPLGSRRELWWAEEIDDVIVDTSNAQSRSQLLLVQFNQATWPILGRRPHHELLRIAEILRDELDLPPGVTRRVE